MERDEIISMGANGRREERGAGGKVRKPPPRKPAAGPYARPPESGQRRWISKLVDPACRLIVGGATRMLPSFMFKTASTPALTGPNYDTEDQGEWQTGEQRHVDDGCKYNSQLGTSKSTEMASTADITDKVKKTSDLDMHDQDEKGEKSENNRLSEIEQLLKERKFSRDEINHLMEILNSRTVDTPNVEQGRENQSLTAKNDDKSLVVTQRVSKISNEQKLGELNGAIWGRSTPLGQSKVQDEFGASPIDVARTYMNSRASEAGPNCESFKLDSKSSVSLGSGAAIKPHVPLPSPKPSAYWPGAVVHDAYLTPQNERSRYGLHSFRRTPYSRTILSKSKSRSIHMQGEYNRMSSTPLHQSRTPLYGQDKSRGDALEGGHGSFGPIRRIKHNKDGGQSSSRRPTHFHSSLKDPSQGESSDVHEGFIPSVTTSQEPDGTSSTYKFHSLDNKLQGSEAVVPTVHMHTSLMARKILEHIDRNPPTPGEKSAELKLATKWKNAESSVDFSTVLSNDRNYLLKSKDIGPYKYDGLDGKNSTLNEGQGKHDFDKPKESTDMYINVRNEELLASDTKVDNNILRLGSNARILQNSGGSRIFPMKSTDEDALKTLPSGGQSRAVDQKEKPVSESSLSKPVLPSISINKPESRWTFASDNSGFTFPVSASSSAFSEPPTPSVIPSFLSGDQNQSKGSSEPSYTFGLKKSSSALVFSFPSTSSTTVLNDAGDINFRFGSNENARLSFSSFGDNAVCSSKTTAKFYDQQISPSNFFFG
ncbi:hypothetical protein L6164_011407 [Bauhinia variegata]|uniref:Uncharacterized protein n=1 Tax=Bauhinia variegata TaxID=167791 RepID=A0ACB9P742_BAUVA|nr:hypothetical protein L6164_011407 [Bauhinia variegata]